MKLMLKFLMSCSIFTEERLERLTKGLVDLGWENTDSNHKEEYLEGQSDGISPNNDAPEEILNETAGGYGSSSGDSTPARVTTDENMDCHQGESDCSYKGSGENMAKVEPPMEILPSEKVNSAANAEGCVVYADDCMTNKQTVERRIPNAVLPLLHYYQYESSESSSRYEVAN